MQKTTPILSHIGFIVDGNRRWAKERNLPTLEGHKKGFEKVEKIVEAIAKAEIPFASFYLFSTENWNRSLKEVSYLMNLFETRFMSIIKTAKKNNLKCIFFSTENGKLKSSIKKKMQKVEEETKNHTGGTICICFNYGGKQEIADAAKKISEENGDFTVENLEKHIYHPEVPPCDLVVRTSGEQRLSGFMLWRAAYSEFLFLDKFWPDIEPSDLNLVLKEYENRSRRFGK